MIGSYRERHYGWVGGDEQLVLISIEAKARLAFQANQAYLAITTPTAAQTRDQVARLTRQTNAILRLLLGEFDTDGDT